MPNRIEITVSGKNEMPATFAEIKGQAGALGADAGKEGGAKFGASFTDTINDAIPPGFEKVAPKIQEPVKKAGKDSADTFTKGFSDQLASSLSGTGAFGDNLGAPVGKKFSYDFGQGVKSSISSANLSSIVQDAFTEATGDVLAPDSPEGRKIQENAKDSASTFTRSFSNQLTSGLSDTGVFGGSLSDALGKEGDPAGRKFTTTFSAAAKGAIVQSSIAGMLAPDSPEGEKVVENAKQTGQQAGQAAGDGMSPLIVSALAGAAAVGAPALLAGLGTAFVGITALALKSNQVIAADYQSLGKEASAALTSAVTPLAGTMHQALTGLEKDVSTLQPQLKGLFADAEPDITAVTAGVGAFASGILPGMSSALKDSQVIVSDMSASLGGLGQGVGGFFQGLTRDASTTGEGLQSLVGTVSHLASTLGGVLGSAASVGSTALMALDPVLNTTFTLIDKVANPATVGALAGVFGAMKLGGDTGALTTGLESISTKLGGFAKDAATTEGALGGLKSAAGGVGSAFGRAADVMSGPWGMAIGAGVGLATGLVGALINASHASDALTLSQQGLDQAVQQDNGHIGDAITAYVAAQAQTDGLAQSAAAANVSLATWTQAVIGNKEAQDAVTASISGANEVTQTAAAAADDAKTQTGKYSGELQDATSTVQDTAAATNKLTDQNKQLINSMQAQNAQIVQAVQKQADYQAALNTLDDSTLIFKASLDAQRQSQIASAQQTALSAVATLNLRDANVLLSQKLDATITAYQEAAQGASGYAAVLQGLNGTQDGLAQAQNTVDQQLVTAKSAFQQNGYAIEGLTKGAVANRTALNQAAVAIQALGTAQYQATGSMDTANSTIRAQIDAYAKATGATGKARQAIEAYLEELAKIPSNVTTNITVDVNQVSVKALGDKLSQGKYATGGNVGAAATGGARGNLVEVGEQGRELVRLPYGSTVIPNSNLQSMAASGGGGGGVVQLEWVGGNAGDDFMRWLRSNIRIRGGNVQRVLGVN